MKVVMSQFDGNHFEVDQDYFEETKDKEDHGESSQKETNGFACDVCDKIVQTRSGLISHQRRFHDNIRRQKFRLSCSEGCSGGLFPTVTALREHYISHHSLPGTKVERSFGTVQEFEAWKNEEEQTSYSKYVVKDTRSLRNRGLRRTIYCCHRSGNPEVKLEGRKRNVRQRGSARCGIVCTSGMTAFVNQNGMVNVTYYPDHWGHERELQYLHLNKDQRREIAEYLQNGYSPDQILEMCHASDNLRLQAVDWATIYRVSRDFHLDWIWGKQGYTRSKFEEHTMVVEDPSEINDVLTVAVQNAQVEESVDLQEANESKQDVIDILCRSIQDLCRKIPEEMIGEDVVEELRKIENKLSHVAEQVSESIPEKQCFIIVDDSQSATLPTAAPNDINVSIINCDNL